MKNRQQWFQMLYKMDINDMLSSFGVDQVRLNKLATLRNILKEREEIALEQRIQIEMFINNIGDSDIRQIFEYRYIDNMSWIEIQLEMKYKHEDTPRKKHDRYLKKFL